MSTPPSITPAPLSRRALAAGIAWTVPVVAVGADLPAEAASNTPTVTNHGTVTTSAGGCGSLTIDGTSTSGQIAPGLTWTNCRTVTGPITVTFYFSVSGLTFTSSATGWPALISNGVTLNSGGTRYYGYSSTYTGAVQLSAGSANLPYFFQTTGCITRPTKFRALSSSVLNGTTTTTDTGYLTLDSNALAARTPESTTAPRAHRVAY